MSWGTEKEVNTRVLSKSAHSRIKLNCSDNILSQSLHQEDYSQAPEHFHLLPSLLSSQTSYPLIIGLGRRNPHNRLLNWQFDTSIKQKLHVPLYPSPTQPICACGVAINKFGGHVFKCIHICKVGACFTQTLALAPALSTAGYTLPHSTIDH